jgi:hypothetical protein
MGFRCLRKINSDYFLLYKRPPSNNSLDFYTRQFNADDYYIYKSTNKFKEVSTKDFLIFRYGGYTFFNKKLYDKNWLDLWIGWTTTNLNIQYLTKPFPPFYPKKIKIYHNTN